MAAAIAMRTTTTLAIPAGLPMFFAGSANNGTCQHISIKIPLHPIDPEVVAPSGPSGPSNTEVALPISVPWSQLYTLSSVGDVDTYEVTLPPGKVYLFTVAGEDDDVSTLEGEVELSAPGMVTRHSWFDDVSSTGINYNRTANFAVEPTASVRVSTPTP